MMPKPKQPARKPEPSPKARKSASKQASTKPSPKPSTRAGRRDDRAAISAPLSPSSPPSGDEIRRARKSGRAIAVTIARSTRTIPLPDQIAALVADALDAYASGHSVKLVIHSDVASPPNPYLILDRDPNDELTTQEAAEALRVSRPTIIKALEEGRLAGRKVGKHRRIRVYDFNAFAQAEHRVRGEVASALSQQSQEFGEYETLTPMTPQDWKRLTRNPTTGGRGGAMRRT
jgi:excisionase family DNA binding protein